MTNLSDKYLFIYGINGDSISYRSVGGLEKKRLSWLHPQDMEALMMDTRIGDRDSIIGEREEIGDEEHGDSGW